MIQPSLFDIPLGMPGQGELSEEELRNAAFISQEDQDALMERLHSHYDKFKGDIRTYHEKLDYWHELYEAIPPAEKNFPWEGSSNFSVPLIRSTIDSMQSRISKSVFEVDPLWLTKPRTANGVEVARKAEAYLDYWADTIDLPRVLDVAIQGMLIEGVGIVKVDWLREYGIDEETGESILMYDAPGVSYVPAKDFVIMPADSPTIEEATYVGHRVYMTHLQLEKRRDAGVYFNVDKLFDLSGGQHTGRKSSHKTDIVASFTGNVKYPETNQYEIIELYGPYDFGNGPVPAVMTFSPHHKILLRLEEYQYMYGKAPYIDFTILPRPNFFWGYSFAEILASPQEELTSLHNARSDALALTIGSPILRRHGAEWDPDVDEFRPGKVINVTDPSEIVQMQIAPVGNAAFAHESDLLAFVERLTGLSDYHMGRNASMGRTATEVNRVTSEGLARLDTMVSRFQHGGMKKLGWMLWWLLYQYRPFMDHFYYDGAEYTITKTEKAPLDNGLMAFELQPHGILSDASKEARRQQKLMLMNTITGVLSQYYPDGVQVLLRDLLHDFDVKNADAVLGPDWSVIQRWIQQAQEQGFQAGQQAVMQQLQAQGG